MTTAEFEKELTTKYGYTSYYDTGVVMFKADKTVEEMEKDIRAKAVALEYNGSWGVRGYSRSDKNHKPVSNISTPLSVPVVASASEKSESESSADTPETGTVGGAGDYEQLTLMDFM